MFELEIREVHNHQAKNLATIKQKHPVTVGMLIRFECVERNAHMVGQVMQFLVDHTGYEFESICVWVQITESRPIEVENDPSYEC